ncbi:hypothetical protein GCM10011349_35660 [Novosphingobium indicum]|jgi:DNA-binding MarR family transcriptional regulator|uniref:MarR family transcriptional regulator n=1 Tax=Novosphingobium indicum TaxID=462949 RepID=A0ABQ2JVV2_9SPHN|nr:MarR family transcriptional regulator [Novosphingobium indicum]GGN57269.1 hypothetical protein GCM10011349_35660 [Novosphingobium indicum]
MDSGPAGGKRLALCRTLILERKLAKELLGAGLCANPIWDMLLELYVADREGVLLCIWQLSVSANIPISSAHRKIDIMVHKGFVERTIDESDLRRVGIQLASPFREMMDQLFDTLTRILMTSCCQCGSGGRAHSSSD